MTCQEALELLGGLVEHDLGAGDTARLRLHLAICRACRDYLDSYRTAVAAGKRAFDELPGADVRLPEVLVDQILRQVDPQVPGSGSSA